MTLEKSAVWSGINKLEIQSVGAQDKKERMTASLLS
jgi:hypothetical protein